MNDVKASVRSCLQSEPRIGEFTLADASFTDDGALLVEGEVETLKAKKLALERIGALPNVDLIVDRLHVRPADAMSDAGIRSHLRDAFVQEPSFAGLRITEEERTVVADVPKPIGDLDFSVADGIVTLNGNAPGLATKRLAGLLAWWVPGSRDVVNGIAVPESETDSPQAIEEAVHIALEKNPFVNAGQIRIGVRHRVVRLTGLVTSDAQRSMAENDAWYVFGVDDVINEIEVGS
jgi:osmotically-inducible protein OsmY